jgi:hypothetical protein
VYRGINERYHFLARATPSPIRLPKANAAPPMMAMPLSPSVLIILKEKKNDGLKI